MSKKGTDSLNVTVTNRAVKFRLIPTRVSLYCGCFSVTTAFLALILSLIPMKISLPVVLGELSILGLIVALGNSDFVVEE